jgi:hypothetical protein
VLGLILFSLPWLVLSTFHESYTLLTNQNRMILVIVDVAVNNLLRVEEAREKSFPVATPVTR